MDDLMDFQCPACGAKLRAPHMAAGRPGRCTKCQKDFIVPAQFAMDSGPASPAPAASSAPPPMINPFERQAAKPKPKPGLGDTLKPMIPAAIAAVLLAAGGWFLWSYFTSGDEEGHAGQRKDGAPTEEEEQRRAALQAEHERQQAAEKAAQALAQEEKAKSDAAAAAAAAAVAAAAAAAAPPPAATAPTPAPSAAAPVVTMSKKEAELLVAGGKMAMLDASTDPSRALAAALAFSRAVPYYEAASDLDKVCDLEANIFWCKKHMTGDSIKVLIEQKTGDDLFKKALDRINTVAAKEIPQAEAKAYFDRAEKFARENPDDFEHISVRYFEVAERFAGTDLSLQAQKISLLAQQKQQKRVQAESDVQRQTLFTKSAPGGPAVQSAVIPGADAMKSAVAAVRKLFKDDYAKTKPNQRRRLIAKLLEQAPLSKDDSNTQYALLTEAIELSLGAGDWYDAILACDLMAQEFRGVEARSKKKEVFAKIRNSPVVAAIIKLIDMPEDAEANSVAGKYFCFDAGKWDIGLPLLARGGDAEYKSAADMELVRPAGAPQQLELADKWYALGKKAKPGARESMLARAFSWYKQADPAITGITKQRIATRIEEIDGLLPMTNLDYDNLTPKQWDRLKGATVEISAGKDRNDTGIAITRVQRVRVVPHPTDTWTSDYFNSPITVNWKGYQGMRVGTFTFSGYSTGSFPIGAMVMQIEQGKLQKPGILEGGEGRIFLGPYAAGWGAGGMGIIRCKILPVTDDD